MFKDRLNVRLPLVFCKWSVLNECLKWHPNEYPKSISGKQGSKICSKQVSKTSVQTSIQNVFLADMFLGGGPYKMHFWVTRVLPQGIRWCCAETWPPSYRKCDKQKSGLSKCMQGKRTALLSASRCFFEIWVWSGAGVCAGRTRAYAQGIRQGIRRVSATLVKPYFSLT